MNSFFHVLERYVKERDASRTLEYIRSYLNSLYAYDKKQFSYVMSLSRDDYVWLIEQHFLEFDNNVQYALQTYAYDILLMHVDLQESLDIARVIYTKYPTECNALSPLLLGLEYSIEDYYRHKDMFLACSCFVPNHQMFNAQLLQALNKAPFIQYGLDSLWHNFDRYHPDVRATFLSIYNIEKHKEKNRMLSLVCGVADNVTEKEALFVHMYSIDPQAAYALLENEDVAPTQECDIIVL